MLHILILELFISLRVPHLGDVGTVVSHLLLLVDDHPLSRDHHKLLSSRFGRIFAVYS